MNSKAKELSQLLEMSRSKKKTQAVLFAYFGD